MSTGIREHVLDEHNRAHNDRKGPLYSHQVDALVAIDEYLSDPSKNIGVCIMPTGSGKSGVAVLTPYMMNKARVLVLTPSEDLSKQIEVDFIGKHPTERCFLEKRGLVEIKDDDDLNLIVPTATVLKKSTDITDVKTRQSNVLITNVHKFGTNSNVTVADLPTNYDLVIVDEAHHYPADTWKRIVTKYNTSRHAVLFLTATAPINVESPWNDVENHTAYKIERRVLEERNVIRQVEFVETDGSEEDSEETAAASIATKVKEMLDIHDNLNPRVKHQAMVLCQSVNASYNTEKFLQTFNAGEESEDRMAKQYVGGTDPSIQDDFKKGKFRVLAVVRRSLEGFDNKNISVAGIFRNVSKTSRVLFQQFVGRSVRTSEMPDGAQDPVKAVVVSHPKFDQKTNYRKLDSLAQDLEDFDEIDADD